MVELELILDQVTEGVLETMFFSPILDSGSTRATHHDLAAMVEFSGSENGALRLSTGTPAAMAHTASFLGLPEAEAPVDEMQAVLGELANVICGATLARIDPAGRFSISPPRVFTGEPAARVMDGMLVVRNFELMEGSLTVGFSICVETPQS